MRSIFSGVVAALIIVAFFVVVSMTVGCGGPFKRVAETLNDQREIYGLAPVSAETCDDLASAFDGYADLVTYSVDDDDPNWATISTSECRTLEAHREAFLGVCEDTNPGIPVTVNERCQALLEDE